MWDFSSEEKYLRNSSREYEILREKIRSCLFVDGRKEDTAVNWFSEEIVSEYYKSWIRFGIK